MFVIFIYNIYSLKCNYNTYLITPIVNIILITSIE